MHNDDGWPCSFGGWNAATSGAASSVVFDWLASGDLITFVQSTNGMIDPDFDTDADAKRSDACDASSSIMLANRLNDTFLVLKENPIKLNFRISGKIYT